MTVSEELTNLCPDYGCRHLQPNLGKPGENIAEQRGKPTLNSSDMYAGVDPKQHCCGKQMLSPKRHSRSPCPPQREGRRLETY